MVEIKELVQIEKRDTGTIVAHFQKEEKDSMEVSVEDLLENLEGYQEDLENLNKEISTIDDEILESQNEKALVEEKRNALARSIKSIEAFIEANPVVSDDEAIEEGEAALEDAEETAAEEEVEKENVANEPAEEDKIEV